MGAKSIKQKNHQAMTCPKDANSMPKCQMCGGLHKIKNCGFRCNLCGKMGHVEKKCLKPQNWN